VPARAFTAAQERGRFDPACDARIVYRQAPETQPRVNDVCSEPISKLTAKLSRHAAQIEVEIYG
jgi:hypothetical protein